MKNILPKALWGLAALYAALLGAYIAYPSIILVVALTLFPVGFMLLHGTRRYGLGGILAFVAIAFVVSNALENLSILTGFPFGHYHYTDALGPKLFLVPILISPAYVGTGYLAWILATVLVGPVRRASSGFTTITVPVIAAFMMVVWDVCFDPTSSTIDHWWIWEQGGGFFGVPLTNYLGWFLTVWLFYQLFALFLRARPLPHSETRRLPASPDGPVVVMYAAIGLSYVLRYLSMAPATQVTDVTGTVWQTSAIYEASALMGIFTMLFIAALAGVKLLQTAQTAQTATAPGQSTADEPSESVALNTEPVA